MACVCPGVFVEESLLAGGDWLCYLLTMCRAHLVPMAHPECDWATDVAVNWLSVSE